MAKTPKNTEEVSSHPREKGHRSQQWRRNTPSVREKPMADWEKSCKSGRSEDNRANGKKQFIYAMNIKSNGKSRFVSKISRLVEEMG
jgi:hypothetical protein